MCCYLLQDRISASLISFGAYLKNEPQRNVRSDIGCDEIVSRFSTHGQPPILMVGQGLGRYVCRCFFFLDLFVLGLQLCNRLCDTSEWRGICRGATSWAFSWAIVRKQCHVFERVDVFLKNAVPTRWWGDHLSVQCILGRPAVCT